MSDDESSPGGVSADADGQLCPECSGRLTNDPRFVSWCPSCDFNLDPLSTDEIPSEELRRRDREFQSALDAASRQRPTPSAAGAFVVATVIHASTLTIAGVGIWLAVAYLPVPLGWVGLLLVVLALTFRPPLGHLPKDGIRINVESAPEFRRLLEHIAESVGADRPDIVMVDDAYNMSFGRVGLRRRSALTIGAPLWAALDGDERVAVLGHELGHDVNGDVRSGVWVGGAIRALALWSEYVHPGPWPRDAKPSEFAAYIAFGPIQLALSWLVGTMVRVLLAMTATNHRAAEFRADELALRVGGTRASVGALAKLDLAGTCMRRLKAARNGGDRMLLEALRAHVADIPDTERERLRRLSARRGTGVDDSHPATTLRIALLERRPTAAQPMVHYQRGIDDELADVMSEAEALLYKRLPALHF